VDGHLEAGLEREPEAGRVAGLLRARRRSIRRAVRGLAGAEDRAGPDQGDGKGCDEYRETG
jgi:hypothetical protein